MALTIIVLYEILKDWLEFLLIRTVNYPNLDQNHDYLRHFKFIIFDIFRSFIENFIPINFLFLCTLLVKNLLFKLTLENF